MSDSGKEISMIKNAEDKAARETAMAAQIEAGRNAVMAALCESPLTYQALIIWLEEMEAGTVMLREVIDLKATYSRWKDKAASTQGSEAIVEFSGDGAGNSAAISALEAKLKPKVFEIFERIADAYRKIHPLLAGKVEPGWRPVEEVKELKRELVTSVNELVLDRNRVEALSEQLREIGAGVDLAQTRLLRRAKQRGVSRDEFLDKFCGSETDPNWATRVGKLEAAGWREFVVKERAAINEAQKAMRGFEAVAGLRIAEIRQIVQALKDGGLKLALAQPPEEGEVGN